ncbi:NAD-dependent epimerase/dehydratase family protein [Streptomyces sp. Je 1-4]|uniref:NAD-dependent epimerase/dehydratase family protein n=1 Tax=Streptomyces TaxID=1883 RepID=UPI001C83B19E|nr:MULTISPECIES: NAD-dependent epimerase/dehydratase family protein [unclassified Streptomyces]UYB44334.1 NAD-dependent epimerase/dehydratase family protein [Streptomyces sp. Je 1-4]UZQ40786.1 NAD-dependent epimerase/dehydratase family protein [Streptomyces sp. Je 1-4] [Streptomyces sp. Je 1-4 4N24]UZQ48203.1 NAD-dependent epimerase/dehydratase family protein [Streptomyces sp. Je 1-4] [Streptomyces sp. Je 1-4 4N24_ara]
MRAVVTGAAGFIGSHLCAHLLASGDTVVGIDALTDSYDPALKARNLRLLAPHAAFTHHRADLLEADLGTLLDGAEVVYHLAGQPGVRPSWGSDFARYANRNLLATQALVEAARKRPLHKFVYASSSSVYGDAPVFPTPETVCPRPVSPYGVTKLAAEHVCELYRTVYGLPTVSLRLFTVYGPRQRPDMAFARLVDAALTGGPFPLYGDGEQTRDFTYVGDVVTAMRAAACAGFTGVANLGGGRPVSMKQAVTTVEQLIGPVTLHPRPGGPGEARHTGADIALAAREFGYHPRTDLYDGLTAMVKHTMTWRHLDG